LLFNSFFTWRRSFAEYWNHFVAHLKDDHAFGYNSAGGERVWMKFKELRVCCLRLFVTDFERDHAEARAGAPEDFFFFLSVNNAQLCRFQTAKFHEICTQEVYLRMVDTSGKHL